MRLTDFTLLLQYPASACVGVVCIVAFIVPQRLGCSFEGGLQLLYVAVAAASNTAQYYAGGPFLRACRASTPRSCSR